jgi:Mg-chelatase subunit ChlD
MRREKEFLMRFIILKKAFAPRYLILSAAACFFIAAFSETKAEAKRETITLLDRSASVLPYKNADAALEKRIAQWQSDSDILRILPFSSSPQGIIESVGERIEVKNEKDAAETDIAQGLAAALALPTPNRDAWKRRVILTSDGRHNASHIDDALLAAQKLSQRAVLDVFPIGESHDGDLRLLSITGPQDVSAGERLPLLPLLPPLPLLPLQITAAAASSNCSARLSITIDGEMQDSPSISDPFLVSPAGITLPITVTLPKNAAHWQTIAVKIIPSDGGNDPIPENDSLRFTVRIAPPKRILRIIKDPTDAPKSAIDASEDVISAADLSRADFSRYASALWEDVPPSSGIPLDSVLRLKEAVQNGMGIVWLYGDAWRYEESHADGALIENKTAAARMIEDMLPAGLRPKARLSVIFALDGSGSMGLPPQGEKISLWAKSAAAAAAAWQMLGEGDWAGLFSFQSDPKVWEQWPLPAEVITENADRPSRQNSGRTNEGHADSPEDLSLSHSSPSSLFSISKESIGIMPKTIKDQLAYWKPFGGTKWLEAARHALDLLEKAPKGGERLILLMTDGVSAESEGERAVLIKTIAERLAETKTRIHIFSSQKPSDWENALLQPLEDGGWNALWTVFEKNRLTFSGLLSHELRTENPRTMRLTENAIVKDTGRTADAFPIPKEIALLGPLKKDADAVLSVKDADASEWTMAAVRRIGLGRSVLLAGRPEKEWGYSAERTRRLIERSEGRNGDGVRLSQEGNRLRISALIPIKDGGENPSVRWTFGGEETGIESAEDPLQLIGDGLWTGTFSPKTEGVWLAMVDDMEAALYFSNREEYLSYGPNGSALERLARAGGGHVMHSDVAFDWDAAPLFSEGAEQGNAAVYWTVAGLSLFFAGLVIRRFFNEG